MLHLLRQHDDDLNDLSPVQIVAIRRIYYLDDPRSVADRLRAGEFTVITAGMEDDTDAINALDREDEQ
ncbi:MAG: hypothetical protein ABSG28_03815 [Methanoregula sp.]|uniref:hypothetical protein n=1 Tax=Methanoregula sp. TaxID=2052170 RepID=UPI003C233223